MSAIRKLRALSLLLAAALLPLSATAVSAAQAEPPEEAPAVVEARASVDSAVATTGDVITYSVVVEHDPEVEVELPEMGAEIAGFRIIDLGADEPITQNGRVTERRWYKLRADLVGSYVLPPVTVSYRPKGAVDDAADSAEEGEGEVTTLSTSEIFVEVESVLPAEGDAADIRDIKPLQPLPARTPWAWIVGGGAALLLVGAVVAYLLWRRRRPTPAAPPIPPHELAFRQLDALRGTDFSDPEAVRRFHFDVSEVLRQYVEGRFGLNATDLTSEEILPLLGSLPGLQPEPAQQLRRFLAATDRVKFAAFEPTPPEIEHTYELALSFVETTVHQPEASTEETDSSTPSTPTPPTQAPPSTEAPRLSEEVA